jgi:predicted site-specific integrase-resolvase
MSKEDKDAPLLTAGELGKLLGVDTRTLQHWVTKGHLTDPPRTKGGHKRFDPAQVAADYQKAGDAVPARLQAFIDAHSVESHIARASTEDLRAELARREERGAA